MLGIDPLRFNVPSVGMYVLADSTALGRLILLRTDINLRFEGSGKNLD